MRRVCLVQQTRIVHSVRGSPITANCSLYTPGNCIYLTGVHVSIASSSNFTGSIAIYDTTDDFSLVAEIQLGPVGSSAVNDIIIHPHAKYAYITDSTQLQFYRVRAKRAWFFRVDNDARRPGNKAPLFDVKRMLRLSFSVIGC